MLPMLPWPGLCSPATAGPAQLSWPWQVLLWLIRLCPWLTHPTPTPTPRVTQQIPKEPLCQGLCGHSSQTVVRHVPEGTGSGDQRTRQGANSNLPPTLHHPRGLWKHRGSRRGWDGSWRRCGKGWERVSRPKQRQHGTFEEVQAVRWRRSRAVSRNSDFTLKAVFTWCRKDREGGARDDRNRNQGKRCVERARKKPLTEHLLDSRPCDSYSTDTLSSPAT